MRPAAEPAADAHEVRDAVPATGGRPRMDPRWRDHIVDACLAVILDDGVEAASLDRIADEARVPLASVAAHFPTEHDVIRAAFDRFADTIADRFEARLAAAATPEQARRAVVDIVLHDVFARPEDLVLSHEIYTAAARRPEFRSVTDRWMTRSRIALRRHFDADTTQLLDALIEGLTMHRSLAETPFDDALVVDAVDRIIGRR